MTDHKHVWTDWLREDDAWVRRCTVDGCEWRQSSSKHPGDRKDHCIVVLRELVNNDEEFVQHVGSCTGDKCSKCFTLTCVQEGLYAKARIALRALDR